MEYVRKNGQMKPKDVKIPGILVDYVVQATTTDACWQTEGLYYDPSFSGEIQKPLAAIENLPFNERKIINRRCAMELKKGDVINLGVGIPADLAKIVNEEPGVDIDDFTMSTESGMIGGVPSALPHFGAAYNAQACIDHGYMFDLIDGGGLNMTCLGLGEVDGDGNNNVSFLGKMMTGPGGFINITQATPKVIFCGTFMNKAKVVPHDGKLEIVEEGKTRKFVSKVKQITFAGQYAVEPAVLYITEWPCPAHRPQGTLIEIARARPGRRTFWPNGLQAGVLSQPEAHGRETVPRAVGRPGRLHRLISDIKQMPVFRHLFFCLFKGRPI